MRVCSIQIDPQAGETTSNLAQAEAGLREAAQEGAQLCLLPEMWPTSFCREVTREVLEASAEAEARIAILSSELRMSIGGSAYGDRGEEKPSNRFHLYEQGKRTYSYDKGHLFSPTAEHRSFHAGDVPPPMHASQFGPVHGVICYDLRFPAWVRPGLRQGSQVMLVCAQWPVERADHLRLLAIGRAVEGQCFVVATNRRGRALIGRRQMELDFPGNSLIVDPDGKVLAEGDPDTLLVHAELDLAAVDRMRRTIPVWEDERTTHASKK